LITHCRPVVCVLLIRFCVHTCIFIRMLCSTSHPREIRIRSKPKFIGTWLYVYCIIICIILHSNPDAKRSRSTDVSNNMFKILKITTCNIAHTKTQYNTYIGTYIRHTSNYIQIYKNILLYIDYRRQTKFLQRFSIVNIILLYYMCDYYRNNTQ